MLDVLLPGTHMILLSGIQTMNKSTTHTRDHSVENRLGKIKKLALYCYFRCNLANRGFRKRMIEIWTEIGRFKVINQRLACLLSK